MDQKNNKELVFYTYIYRVFLFEDLLVECAGLI